MHIIERMNEPRSFIPDDESVVVVPAGAKELLAELAAIREAEIAVDVRKLETVHALCLVYGTVDEDAFGEAAEQLIYRGAQGTPPVAEYLSLEVSALLGISPGSGGGVDRPGPELCLSASGVVGCGAARERPLVPRSGRHR